MYDSTTLASQQPSPASNESSSFSQYLSLRFYKDQQSDATKDSINNFLKSTSEIEDDFLLMMQQQQMKNLELHDFGFNSDAINYMEENY